MHLLFEHKSYVESRISLDLLRYRVRIWELWREAGHPGRLPVIVPVVVYHGLEAWRVSRQFADGVVEVPALRAYVPECVYHRVDLSDYRDEELRGAVVMHTALLALKYIFRNELRERIWRRWRSGGTSSGDQDLNSGIWSRTLIHNGFLT